MARGCLAGLLLCLLHSARPLIGSVEVRWRDVRWRDVLGSSCWASRVAPTRIHLQTALDVAELEAEVGGAVFLSCGRCTVLVEDEGTLGRARELLASRLAALATASPKLVLAAPRQQEQPAPQDEERQGALATEDSSAAVVDSLAPVDAREQHRPAALQEGDDGDAVTPSSAPREQQQHQPAALHDEPQGADPRQQRQPAALQDTVTPAQAAAPREPAPLQDVSPAQAAALAARRARKGERRPDALAAFDSAIVTRLGEASEIHLLRVGAGLDSDIVGDHALARQLKELRGRCRGDIRELIDAALAAGRTVRDGRRGDYDLARFERLARTPAFEGDKVLAAAEVLVLAEHARLLARRAVRRAAPKIAKMRDSAFALCDTRRARRFVARRLHGPTMALQKDPPNADAIAKEALRKIKTDLRHHLLDCDEGALVVSSGKQSS